MPATIFFNLNITTILVLGLVYLVYFIHLLIKDASIIDLFWGAGFGLVAVLLLASRSEISPYLCLLAFMPIIWAFRYTIFILRRNFGKGEDDRYSRLRQKADKEGTPWWLYSFGWIYTFQGLSMLVVCAPLIIGLAAPASMTVKPIALLGTLLWIVGFCFETIADRQLQAFKAEHKDYDGLYADKPLMDQGLWKYSRHPNYFGNSLMWWGIGLVALQAPYGWIALIGPVYMFIALYFLTGKANNESKMMGRKSYQDYMARTSGFFPLPPRRKS